VGGYYGVQLNGGGGADTITGGEGYDAIIGGSANDRLTGGGGGDQFTFDSIASGVDTITDFSGSIGDGDTLTFEGLLAGSFDYRGALAFTASGNTEARVVGNQVLFDADGNGSSDIAITLLGLTDAAQLSSSDFMFT
jgi:Ca2+-binding RTX toxin-like protein